MNWRGIIGPQRIISGMDSLNQSINSLLQITKIYLFLDLQWIKKRRSLYITLMKNSKEE